VDWRWVKGHAGDPGNERADALANRGMTEAMRGRAKV
jgi:ribonuclease HI